MKITKNLLSNSKSYRVLISTVGLIAILLSSIVIVRPQNSNTSTNLRGQTQEVLVIPGTTTNAGVVNFVSDRDNDGMSDGDEERNGTNPDDPADADGDLDGDGVSNGDEVAKGTNPNVADTDADGVSDADEIRLGYDPLDPNNTPPPNTTIVTLQVSPSPLGLITNTIFGATPMQLTVTGITNSGTSVDLTNNLNTTYQSLDASVAVVSTAGSVFGIATGSTTIRVQNGTLTTNVPVNVAAFDPSPLAAIQIPGYANNVEVSGNYAYVAAGSTGLQIVDITDKNNPQIVASLDTPGNADDVRIAGNFAYIADGNAGLQIINITDPLNPVLSGTADTPGDAQDVSVHNQQAFIADGNSGLQIIDVSNPEAPVVTGSTDTPFIARGVDVSGNYAVVADDYQEFFSAIRVIDISNPADPQIVGNLLISANAKDLVVRGNLAYIAGYSGGFQIVDFSNPNSPTVAGSLTQFDPGGFVPRDVELQDDYAFAAEQRFANAVPIVNISNPANPAYRGVIDFSTIDDYAGTGIALDSEYVYMTGERYFVGQDYGDSGDTKLFIGRHKVAGGDTGAIAPTVSLTSPTVGESVREGRELYLSAVAADDVFVTSVQFKVNGNIVSTDTSRPYEFFYQVPPDTPSIEVTAAAFDLAGNTATTAPVSVTVTPNAPPSISITGPAENSTFIEGETILLQADATDDEAVTQVRFAVNGDELGFVYYPPYEIPVTVPTGVTSFTVTAEAFDTANLSATSMRTFNVIPDPGTTVTGRVLKLNGQPVGNAEVSVFGSFTAQTAADGTFSISNVPTIRGAISVKASALLSGIPAGNLSITAAPVRGGTINVGDIKLSVGPTSPTTFSVGFFGLRDGNIFSGQDLFVTYNDRLSSVYSFNGTDFVLRTVEQMETGSVTAGSSSVGSLVNSFGDNQTFVQLGGQPGFIDKFNAISPDNILRTKITTGLGSDSQYIGFGRDSATGDQVIGFLSNNEPGGAVINLRIGNEDPYKVQLPTNTDLHSLVLNDFDNNGFTDILAIKPLSNGAAKLISIRRYSQPPSQFVDPGSFETPVESDIIERVANPTNGLNNVVAGNFTNNSGKEVAVLGDDRVRIYNYAAGEFVLQQEIMMPAGETPTGIFGYALTRSSFADLLITTQNTTNPDARSLLIYFNAETGGGCGNCSFSAKKNEKGQTSSQTQELFNAPTSRSYTISGSNGDSRIFVGNWGGASNRLDAVIVEGDEVKIFFDVSPTISGS